MAIHMAIHMAVGKQTRNFGFGRQERLSLASWSSIPSPLFVVIFLILPHVFFLSTVFTVSMRIDIQNIQNLQIYGTMHCILPTTMRKYTRLMSVQVQHSTAQGWSKVTTRLLPSLLPASSLLLPSCLPRVKQLTKCDRIPITSVHTLTLTQNASLESLKQRRGMECRHQPFPPFTLPPVLLHLTP